MNKITAKICKERPGFKFLNPYKTETMNVQGKICFIPGVFAEDGLHYTSLGKERLAEIILKTIPLELEEKIMVNR